MRGRWEEEEEEVPEEEESEVEIEDQNWPAKTAFVCWMDWLDQVAQREASRGRLSLANHSSDLGRGNVLLWGLPAPHLSPDP